MSLITARLYTSEEGGEWHPWKSGKFRPEELKKRDPKVVAINGCLVHSMVIGKKRWDCINGWTGKF